MAKFTAVQERAINEQSKTLLVSAAAGSGKTTTLVERILRSVVRKEDPIPLDRILVVTFTKDAASELRLRISAAVSNAIAEDGGNEHLSEQISLLPSAKFSTIDSFCLDLVRSNYASLGLSPSFRIADPGEASLIESDMMERLINRCYDDPESKICGSPEGFANLVDLLCGSGSDARLSEMLLSLYQTLSAYPRGAAAMYDCAAVLREYAKNDFFECSYGQRIKQHLDDVFSHYKAAYRAALDIIEADEAVAKAYFPAFNEDYEGIIRAKDSLTEGYNAGRDAIKAIAFSRLGSFRGEKTALLEQVKDLRNSYKADIASIINGYLSTDSAALTESMLTSAGVCHALGDFLTEFEKILESEKKRKNICSFSDLSRYALRLLVDTDGNDTPFALEQKQLYDAVYIDEYQDVNAVQDRIFSAISTKTNRFMVGDIKQSIYAFRGAESSIFSNLRYAYPSIDDAADSTSATIFMSENFRCSKEIIEFTNHIFDRLMPLVSPDMHYTKEDSLVFRKICKSDIKCPVQVVITEKPPKDSPDAGKNTEAEFVADEIYRLIHSEVKDNGEPITPDDIAILMSAPKSKSDIFADALRRRGIPVSAKTDEDLLMQSEVEIVRCLIDVIDNPRRDISLAGVLLSPLCGIDCDFLARVRHTKKDVRLITTLREVADGEGEEKEKITAFLSRLANFRRMARFMSAGELLDAIYAELAILARLGGESIMRRANLEKFRQVAYTFSASSGGNLSAFLRYLRSIESNSSTSLAAAKPSETRGAVRIMSVHKSKGLEFPVVFFAGTSAAYNLKDTTKPILYKDAYGFGMKLRDETGFCVYDTLLRKSVSIAMQNAAKEEELRLLYVALTRARERLYMSAMLSSPEKLMAACAFESSFLSPYAALNKTTHIELAMLALGAKEQPYVTLRSIPYIYKASDGEEIISDKADEVITPDENTVAPLTEKFNYSYPHTSRTKIPAKLSISRLYPDILDDAVFDTSIGEKPLPKVTDAPRFISSNENIAAKRGTATHLFLQFFDFANAAENGAKAELRRLCEKHFITAEDAALVNLDEVEKFLSSTTFKEMSAARKIYREQRFNLMLPAAEFAADAALKEELREETVLVQGVIDCFYYNESGEIVLVDYKTDRLPKEREAAIAKLRCEHSRQLSYYARAIEEICGERPAKCLIFSLALGEAVDV